MTILCLATFITARIFVFLIMSRTIPDLLLHLGGAHVHHLNCGIFLLAGVGAYLIFQDRTRRRLRTLRLIPLSPFILERAEQGRPKSSELGLLLALNPVAEEVGRCDANRDIAAALRGAGARLLFPPMDREPVPLAAFGPLPGARHEFDVDLLLVTPVTRRPAL